MDEAEQLCDRIAVIDAGRIVAQGAPAELIARSGRRGSGRGAADPGRRDPRPHETEAVRGLVRHAALSLRLNGRNRMAMIYGYLFPLIFLVAFWAIYRHDRVPLALHLGQLLTVTVLGGACFGLPTTMVSERERGVWRRYRLTPLPGWAFVLSTLCVRYLLLLSAALLQIALAFAIGMPLRRPSPGSAGGVHRRVGGFHGRRAGDRHAGRQCSGGTGIGAMHLPADADDRRGGGSAVKLAGLGAARFGILSRPLCRRGPAGVRDRAGPRPVRLRPAGAAGHRPRGRDRRVR